MARRTIINIKVALWKVKRIGPNVLEFIVRLTCSVNKKESADMISSMFPEIYCFNF